jgi:hypothetical protein
MTSYSHAECVELARLALVDCKDAVSPAVSQLRALFPILTLRGAITLIEEARGYKFGTSDVFRTRGQTAEDHLDDPSP